MKTPYDFISEITQITNTVGDKQMFSELAKLVGDYNIEIRKDQERITIEDFIENKFEDKLMGLNYRLVKIEKW